MIAWWIAAIAALVFGVICLQIGIGLGKAEIMNLNEWEVDALVRRRRLRRMERQQAKHDKRRK